MNKGEELVRVYVTIFNVCLLVVGVSFILTGVMIGVLDQGEEVMGTVIAVDDIVTKDGYKKVDVSYTYAGERYFVESKTDKLDVQQGDFIKVAHKGETKLGITLCVGFGSLALLAALYSIVKAKRRETNVS